MEGPVKERLTGALILIAALVIVVPEMLSGPDVATPSAAHEGGEAGPPVRTYELQLDTPAATRSEDQSALSPQSATSQAVTSPVATSQPATPVPAVTPAASTTAPPVAEKPVPVAAQAPASAPSAVVTGGNWWVQLGSFSARENAERLGKQLRAAGFPISVSPIKSNGKELFRVRAGPVASREAAAGLQSRLAAAGHKSSLVAP